MDIENQAALAFEENCTNENFQEAVDVSSPAGGAQASPDNSAISSEIGRSDPSYVLAKDIQLDPNLHERRAFSEDDLAFANAVVSQSHLVVPFPVVRRGNGLFLVDGYVHLRAIVESDHDALVKVIEVSEKDALAIRFADTRKGRNREPMVSSRQALARHRSGVSQEAIAKELGVSAGNVSQMISAAEAEEELCGVADLLRTGKGGRYRYYSCNSKVNRGASACDCPNVRAEKLDELVLGEVADRVFGEEHLEPLLTKVLDTSDESRQRKLQELEQCEAKLADARRRLSNLHDAIETGAVSPRDPDITARLKQRRAEIDGLNTTVTTLNQQLERGPTEITPAAVQRFGNIVRRELKHGPIEARQQIARAFIEKIRIGSKVEISGQTDALAHGAASVARSTGEVPIFDRKWCRLRDSNT